MDNSVEISVIIPMYNSQQYIRKTLLSVISQSFNDIEIIVVDDGSTDESSKIARQVLDEYSDVKSKIIVEENKGLPGARNTGISVAEGKYVCYIDSDDVIDELHLESLYLLTESNHLNLAYSFFELTDEKNREGSLCQTIKGEVLTRDEVVCRALTRKPAIIVCGLLVRLDFLLNNKLFFNEKLKYGEDSDYIWKTILKCDRIGYTKNNTYKYLMHSNSIMKTISEEKANVFVAEFGRTIQLIQSYENVDTNVIQMIYYREILGFLHAYSMCSDIETFLKIGNRLDKKNMVLTLKRFPDYRVRIVSCLYKVSPHLFYRVFHK